MNAAEQLRPFQRVLSWSLFGGAKDNDPDRHNGTWEELAKTLTHVNKTPKRKDLNDAKKAVPAFSGTAFFEGTTRACENAESLHLLVFDFDNTIEEPIPGEFHKGSNRPKLRKVPIEEPAHPGAVVEKLTALGYAAVVYTTWSHSGSLPKFRVVIPLAAPISAAYWVQATEWSMQHLGFKVWKDTNAIDIPVLRDVARLSFLPCTPDPEGVKVWQINGKHLAIPEAALPTYEHEDPPKPVWAKPRAPLNERTGRDWWRDFKIDFKTLDLEGLLRAMGIQVGKAQPWSGGFKWRCHCPWASEHTHGLDDDSAVIIRTPGSWPAFKCLHSGHALVGLREICETAGVSMTQAHGTPYRPLQEQDPDEEPQVPPPAMAEDQLPPVWDMLTKDGNGNVRKTPGNLAKIIRFDPAWGTRLALNEMSQEVTLGRHPIEEPFVDEVQEWVEDHYGLSFGLEIVESKVRAQAYANPFHPVREYLEALKWDGKERFQMVIDAILHAEPHELNIEYVRGWAIGAVRRVYEPGCKVDTTLNLVGDQGTRKSTFFAVLGGEWFGDSHIDVANKDGLMVLHRSWIHEFGEIDGVTKKQDQERLKAFITSRKDIFRPPFGRVAGVYPRSCVIVGSTNESSFLVDPSGSRRFWVMRVLQTIDTDRLENVRDQFWAEAVHLHKAGVPHWLEEDMEAVRSERAAEFEADDPWAEQVATFAKDLFMLHPSDGVAVFDLLDKMDIPVSARTRATDMKIANILRKNGFVRKLLGDRRLARWFIQGTVDYGPILSPELHQ